ncbi:hypothetical protein HAHI6034_11010 [Hathewaya histolytica]|uniref:Uncharacterized protein n=1 Tax=Hathewaya histolytica TaxID=1498 RepID=A0A4U9RA97_HATHI|nr:hypothetical protein [Hathewaya histolytica]VTQ88575.1 Uncharacterised protein [Hathewaya histolytica]
MKVKVKCDECKTIYKIDAESLKEAKSFKKATSCTCMKCMSLSGVDLVKIHGNTVMLVWN